MAKLHKLLIADPAKQVAERLAALTDRLAMERIVVTSGADVIRLAKQESPEAIVLSLEITKPSVMKLVPKLRQIVPDALMIATFRELGVPMMDKLCKFGIEDFIAHPIDMTQLFRAASAHFKMPFRQHPRVPEVLRVFRADGVHIGQTIDLSIGGVQMQLKHRTHLNQSLLIDLELKDEKQLRVRCEVIEVDERKASDGVDTVRAQFENLRGAELDQLIDFLKDKKGPAAE